MENTKRICLIKLNDRTSRILRHDLLIYSRVSEITLLKWGRNDIRGERQLKNLMKGLTIWKTNLFVPTMWHRN